MTDHEAIAGNETLLHPLFSGAENSPDEDAAPDQIPSSRCEKRRRSELASDGCLDLPLGEDRLEEEALEHMANDFVARVIQEYERVLQSGLPPSKAIASVVGWASCECERIRS